MFIRYIAVAIIFIGGYFAMTYMQNRFDEADLKNAVTAVQALQPIPGQPISLTEAVARKYEVSPQKIRWHAKIASKFWGTVQVTAKIPNSDVDLRWQVDLGGQAVQPKSAAAAQLVDKID